MNLKNKLKKTKQNRSRIIDMEIIWRVTGWDGEGENGGKVRGLRNKISSNRIGREMLRTV